MAAQIALQAPGPAAGREPAGSTPPAAGGGPLARATAIGRRNPGPPAARSSAPGQRARAHSHSRRPRSRVVIAAGVLALVGALALIAALVHSMRGPLDELVRGHPRAGRRRPRAGGCDPAGPRELRELGVGLQRDGRRPRHARRRRSRTSADGWRSRSRASATALLVTEPGLEHDRDHQPAGRRARCPSSRPGERVDGDGQPAARRSTWRSRRETVIEHDGRDPGRHRRAARAAQADGVVWTVRDVTERARLERAKSEFVATASHELRSPLTSIKGFVELLERSPENMSARQREFVDIILRSTDRLVELVNDLLDVARIEADSVEISRRADRRRRGGARGRRADGPADRTPSTSSSASTSPPPCRWRWPTRGGSARSSPTCSPTPTSTPRRAAASTSASRPTAPGCRSSSPTRAWA